MEKKHRYHLSIDSGRWHIFKNICKKNKKEYIELYRQFLEEIEIEDLQGKQPSTIGFSKDSRKFWFWGSAEKVKIIREIAKKNGVNISRIFERKVQDFINKEQNK